MYIAIIGIYITYALVSFLWQLKLSYYNGDLAISTISPLIEKDNTMFSFLWQLKLNPLNLEPSSGDGEESHASDELTWEFPKIGDPNIVP